MANKKFKDMVTECNDDAKKKDVCNVAKDETTSKKDKSETPEECELPKQDAEGNYTYVQTDKVLINSTGVWINGKYDFYPIADFPFLIKNLIRDKKDNVSFIIQVGNNANLNMGEPQYMNISNENFSSLAKFRKELRKKQLTMLGKDDDFFKVLQAMPKVSESQYVDVLGWNNDAKAYFFSNVAVKEGKAYQPDDFGLIKFGEKSFFMPYVQSITGGLTDETSESFKYSENKNINFNSWFQMLFDAHKEYCIMPTCFMIASLFRDIIFSETHFMPILYLKGVRGSGKSSIIRNITSVFGSAQKEISLKSNQNTPKSMSRLMAQKSNALLWLDEYHNGVNPNIQGMLQSFYDGAGYQRAAQSNDLKIDSVEIKSSLCLTSNYLPEDEIFFTRTILVQANETKKTSEQRDAFKKLTQLEKNNLSEIACELLQYRDLIEKEFKDTYESLFSYFFDSLPGIDTRFFDNMACILAPVFVLLKEKKIRMVTLDFIEQLAEFAKKSIKEQFGVIKENNVAIEYWNIINILFDRRILKKGVDFKLMPKKLENGQTLYDEYIAIRFNRINVMYQKESGNKAKSAQEIRELLETSDYFVEKKQERFTDEDGKPTSPTSALVLNYQTLKRQIGINLG